MGIFKRHINAHGLYIIGLAMKAFDAVLEIAGAVLILVFDVSKWPKFMAALFREELLEDPNDLIANFFINFAAKADLSIQLSGFLYLLSHGLVKVFIVISLLKRKYWAYPLSEVVLALFVAYQTYLYIGNHSPVILVLNFIDITLMILIWMEYKKVRKQVHV